ncbi:MAG: hypothetical protein RR145_05110, partial [Oscillospiraceae bacterium]
MKKIMSIVLVLTMLMSLAISMTSVNAAVDVEAAQSTASSYDVHIEGNLVIGQTLTAEYTYYDEGGKPEIANGAQYQWY